MIILKYIGHRCGGQQVISPLAGVTGEPTSRVPAGEGSWEIFKKCE